MNDLKDKPAAGQQGSATIGRSIFINGTVQGEEDLVIEGRVEGTIQMQESKVTVAESGNVVADITAKSIIVEGTVRGELRAAESIELKATGQLTGDIRAPRVMLGDGCQFKGTVDMDHKPDGSINERARNGKPMPVGASRPMPGAGGLLKPSALKQDEEKKETLVK